MRVGYLFISIKKKQWACALVTEIMDDLIIETISFWLEVVRDEFLLESAVLAGIQ